MKFSYQQYIGRCFLRLTFFRLSECRKSNLIVPLWEVFFVPTMVRRTQVPHLGLNWIKSYVLIYEWAFYLINTINVKLVVKNLMQVSSLIPSSIVDYDYWACIDKGVLNIHTRYINKVPRRKKIALMPNLPHFELSILIAKEDNLCQFHNCLW